MSEVKLLGSERLLVNEAAAFLPEFFGGHGDAGRLVIRREVGAGRRVADLVVFQSGSVNARAIPNGLTITESVVMASLRRLGPTRIDRLEARCRLPHGGLRCGALRRLLEHDLIARERGGQVSIGAGADASGKIIAIEAKLSRWRGAIEQAQEYMRYADESYVLLPGGTGSHAQTQSRLFEEAGVGLLSLTQEGLVRMIAPSVATDHDWRREYVKSRLLLQRREERSVQ